MGDGWDEVVELVVGVSVPAILPERCDCTMYVMF